jgi:hypothetical protein
VHNFLGAQFNILAYCWQVLIAIAGSLPNGWMAQSNGHTWSFLIDPVLHLTCLRSFAWAGIPTFVLAMVAVVSNSLKCLLEKVRSHKGCSSTCS